MKRGWRDSRDRSLASAIRLLPFVLVGLCLGSRVCSCHAQAISAQSRLASSIQSQLSPFNHGDARLSDLAVISQDRVCVVGDAGTILITNNAGRTWRQVPSATPANLNAVVFFNAHQGIAVGGAIGAYSGFSRGVVLRTSDGGESWESVDVKKLPRLLGIVEDGGQLLAWGDFDSASGSSVFRSHDGGVTWQGTGIPLGHAAAVAQATGRIVAQDRSHRFVYQPTLSADSAAQRSPITDRRDQQVQFLGSSGKTWIACGSGGLLKWSADGVTWRNGRVALSEAALSCCDWLRVSQNENGLWACGSPGSVLLHSADHGQTWVPVPTGHPLPLHCVRFLDELRGWAVGALGTILATRDGGQSWYRQRGVAAAGLLSFSESETEIPWTALNAAAWDARVPSLAVVGRSGAESVERGWLPSSWSQSRETGASIGVPVWPKQCEDTQLSTALALAMWRPKVVLCSSTQAPTLFGLIRDSTAAAENSVLRELGLTPHRIQKLVTSTEPAAAQYSEQDQRVLRDLGLTIADIQRCLPQRLSQTEGPLSAEISHLRTLWAESANKATQTSFLGGVAFSPSELRPMPPTSIGNYQTLMGRAHRFQSLRKLVEHQESDELFVRDLDFVVHQLPDHEKGAMIWELAQQLKQAGRIRRSIIVFKTLVDQVPGEDVSVSAMIELLQLEGSAEIAHWSASTSGSVAVSTAAFSRAAEAVAEELQDSSPWNTTPFEEHVSNTAESATDSAVQFAAAVELPVDPQLAAPVANAWFADYERLQMAEPRLATHPAMVMLSHRRRMQRDRQGSFDFNEHGLRTLLASHQATAWSLPARQEILVELERFEELSQLVIANRSGVQPLLDASLDDSSWSESQPLELQTTEQGGLSTQLLVTYDDRFLYLGFRCERDGHGGPMNKAPRRSYDSDLSALDHVRIQLDTDRDYSSGFEFGIAENGQTFDRLNGVRTYNPKWFVCTQSNDDHWVAEVAIELASLVAETQLDRQSWAVSIVRQTRDGTTASYFGLRPEGELHDAGLMRFQPQPQPQHTAPGPERR